MSNRSNHLTHLFLIFNSNIELLLQVKDQTDAIAEKEFEKFENKLEKQENKETLINDPKT